MRDEENCADGPSVEVVVQDEEIGGSVFENGALHFGVSCVDNFRTEGFRLAFQLEGRFAGGAEVVDCGCALWRRPKAWRLAGGAEEICGAPRFGADAGALRGAFVTVEASRGKMQVHAEIRSWVAPPGTGVASHSTSLHRTGTDGISQSDLT